MFEVVRNLPAPTPYGSVDLAVLEDHHARGFTVWWLGNAGFAINWAGRAILIDPIIEVQDESDPLMSEIGLRLRGALPLRASHVTRADLILLTHDDGDHTGPKTTPELIVRTAATFVGTERTARKLREHSLSEGRIRLARYTVRGDCCGFIVRGPGLSLWHPDDTDLLEEHLQIKGIDLLLLPIAPHVLGTQGSIALAASCGAQHIIPCHYGTYDSDEYWCTGDPEAVRAGIENADSRYHMLPIGERFALEL